jgi:biotin synthase-like enzyme
MTKIIPLKCSVCGGSIDPETLKCMYCGTSFVIFGRKLINKQKLKEIDQRIEEAKRTYKEGQTFKTLKKD